MALTPVVSGPHWGMTLQSESGDLGSRGAEGLPQLCVTEGLQGPFGISGAATLLQHWTCL